MAKATWSAKSVVKLKVNNFRAKFGVVISGLGPTRRFPTIPKRLQTIVVIMQDLHLPSFALMMFLLHRLQLISVDGSSKRAGQYAGYMYRNTHS